MRVPTPHDAVHADQSVHGVKLPFTEMMKDFIKLTKLKVRCLFLCEKCNFPNMLNSAMF